MKIFPVKTLEITKRLNKGYNTNWCMITWNDGSRSWRRVYNSKKLNADIILNKGVLYKLVYDNVMNYYSFTKLSEEEKKKADDVIKEVSSIEEIEEIASQITEEISDDGYVKYDANAIHHEKKTILDCVDERIPVYLVGPAGTGKSTVLKKIASELGLNFYSTNAIQDEYKLTGYCDAAGDFHKTEFYKAFSEDEEGGLFLIDEMDASIPQVLTLLNTAIANGYYEFPNGRKNMNKNFRCVAAGNTFGNGADESYTGRMVLDQATLDRFVAIEYDYDYNVELAITKGNKWLVDFIHELRDIAKRNSLRVTFSYRCLEMITALEKRMSLEKIFKIVLFKGMDEDTLNLFNTLECKTKYEKALANMMVA